MMNYTELLDFRNVQNISIWEYIEKERGPQRLPLEVVIPFSVINIIIFITGLLGNICVCIVIVKHPTLHTSTNYYLFNLAASDLILLIFGLPNDVAIYWHQYPWLLGEVFCKLRALLSEMASYVSVLTIVAFSTERYLAICYPLYLQSTSGLQRPLLVIVCIWVVGFVSAAPFSVYTNIDYLTYPESDVILEESAFCAMLAVPEHFPLAEFSTLVFFIIPIIIIAVQYTKMGVKIWRQGKRFGKRVHRGSRKIQSNKTVVRMLAAVVVGFFVCWAPFHAQRLLFVYGREYSYFHDLNAWMFYITGVLYYLSSTLNPILYNVMSKRYRNAFKETILCIPQPHRSFARTSTFRETKRSTHLDGSRRDDYDPMTQQFIINHANGYAQKNKTEKFGKSQNQNIVATHVQSHFGKNEGSQRDYETPI